MNTLSLLIKPSSSHCNLKCTYCFYHNLAENRTLTRNGFMEVALLETIVQKALNTAKSECNFIFQGGEPTLVGLDFYIKLIEFQKKYNNNHIKITNAIQTNGILINDAMATFFSENDFLVGISLDGEEALHDAFRIDNNGEGTFSRVMLAIALLEKHRVKYNILTVVNNLNAPYIDQIYTFYKKNNFKYLQFIPCIDPMDVKHGDQVYSLDNDNYTYFLKTLFDLWYEDIMNGSTVSIRYFDNLVGMFLRIKPEACGMLGQCQLNYVIESDGSIYPCDFYVTDAWRLGNITESTFEALKGVDAARLFVESSLQIAEACKTCKWGPICRGGCRRNRDVTGSGVIDLNYFCHAYKAFFEYSVPRLKQISETVRI